MTMKSDGVYKILLVVLAVFVCICESSTLKPSQDSRDLMFEASSVITSVLHDWLKDNCIVIILSDGSVSHNTIFKMDELRSAWGIGVFEVIKGHDSANLTHTLLSHQIAQARKLRQVSWCVNILVISEDTEFLATFAELSLKGRLLVWYTKLTLVTSIPRDNLNILLSSHWTFSMMNTMTINMEDGRFGVFVHMPYNTQNDQLVQVASWNKNRGLSNITRLPLFPDKYLNFQGARINITVLPFEPYWKDTKKGNITIHSGMDYEQLLALCQFLNFTYRIIPSKTWAEVTGQVETRDSLMATIMYAILPERAARWTFTFIYDQSGVAFAMAVPVLKPNWLNFYYPLNGKVWIGVVISTCIVCTILVYITGSKFWASRHGRLDNGKVVLEAVGGLLGQGFYGRLVTSHNNHTIVGCWLFFGVVLGTAYRASLIASLTLPRLPPRPETIEQLVTEVDKVTMEDYGSAFQEFFIKSETKVFRTLGQLMEPGATAMQGLTWASTNRYAHAAPHLNQQLKIAKYFTQLDGTAALYLGRQHLLQMLLGWMLPLDAPYKQPIDTIFMLISQAGLYEQWKREALATTARENRIKKREEMKFLKEEGTYEAKPTTAFRSLTFTHIQGPLLLLLVGLILSALAFLMEKFIV